MSKDRKKRLKELRSKLSKNQKIFCDEYLIDRNGTRSYKVAFSHIKKDGTARTQASQLLTNLNIKEYIQLQLDEISDKAGITVERILIEEKHLATSDIRKMFDGEFVTVPPGELPDDIAAAVAGVEVKDRFEDGNVIERTFKYKLWDKGGALNRLEKINGMHQQADTGVEAGLKEFGEKLALALGRLK